MTVPMIVLDVRCQCRGRPRIPVRMAPEGLVALRAQLNGHARGLEGNVVFQTHYCPDCRAVTPITFRDLMLAA